MELVYLWVEKYKNIEKQGFNFSPKFRCEYNPDTEELKIEENPNVSIFPDNINITAIVGKNGSGKSNLLEMLKYWICELSENKEEYICFILLYNNKTDRFYFHSNDNNLKIKIINNKFSFYEKLNFHKNDIYNIFYSNNPKIFIDYDNNKKNFSKHLCNISDKYLYNKISKEIREQFKSNLTSFQQILRMYNYKLLQYGIIAFYEKKLAYPDGWNLPEKLIVGFKDNFILNSYKHMLLKLNEKIKKDYKLKREYDNLNYIEELIRSEYGKPLFDQVDWQYFLKWLSILNFIVASYQGIGEFINKKFIMDAIKQAKIENDYKKSIDIFLGYFNKNFKIDKDTVYSFPKKYFNNIKDLILNLEKFDFKNGEFHINFNKKNYEFILKIIKLHQQITITVPPFLTFDLYPWMSDGQQEYFYIFAKIYMALSTPFSNIKPKKGDTVFMLLDEMINFLHPNWQKHFIKIFIDFLEKNYKNYKFHIILTTHSPFIISDLPKENIIFLDKEENGKCKVVDGLNEKKETFGANIHTLLSDSFFMEDGFIGKFAESQIDEVIRYLNGEKIKDMNDKKAQKIINIIGEPILRKELQGKLDSKRLSKIKEVDKIKREMRMLKNRMKELERLLNEKDSNN